MNSFLGCAALDVGDIGAQDLTEVLHGIAPVGAGENPRMHDSAQGRSIRGAGKIVIHGAWDLCGREAVAKPGQQADQLVGRQQVEQHQRVGLLGRLVVVHAVALGFQDPVESLDVSVSVPIVIPIQFRQFRIALELADHAVVEWNEHASAHVVPLVALLRCQPELFDQMAAIGQR
ncbi:Uncharacterised protein [Mycobacterium tuberculosis]|uniref:Uncharacterized protein n=1 Tax=Mycobacterium tuberculosis TaxID=1773 RepID=A0A0U0S0P0_MYCTX|nr:Uncharacterised protein [Mycobacterium tuberculosis]CKR54950.1 Uncharacterised protein [Mycobacterium tuberculosis]COW40641.1 Uncharacterised protein [Mycobacterium tuberculosis]COW93824.1 Uncharacterised protein [Mycobacterium tuberculosis]